MQAIETAAQVIIESQSLHSYSHICPWSPSTHTRAHILHLLEERLKRSPSPSLYENQWPANCSVPKLRSLQLSSPVLFDICVKLC